MKRYKNLEGYKHYNIYSDGTIIRKKHTNTNGTHLAKTKLKPTKEKNGYISVVLVNDSGEHVKWYLHRLLYTVFVGEIKNGYEIDHIDGNRANNNLINLRMMTHRDNTNTATAKERYKRANAREQGKYDKLRLMLARTKNYEKSVIKTYKRLLKRDGVVKVTTFMREAHIGYQRAIRIMKELSVNKNRSSIYINN